MSFECSECDGGELVYKDANTSECKSCGNTVPNSHLRQRDAMFS